MASLARQFHLLLLSFFFAAPGLLASPPSCLKTRAAFDIGSKGTKVKVAQVDVCSAQVVKLLLEKDIKVGYKQDLVASPDGNFSGAVMDEGIRALKGLKSEVAVFLPTAYSAVATAAFREARNAVPFVGRIRAETGIPVRIISQSSEGALAFKGAVQVAHAQPGRTVVWDIGGGSQQISVSNPDGSVTVAGNQLGSVAFREYVVTQIEHKAPDASPNPLKEKEAQLALQAAEAAGKQIDPEVAQRFSQPQVVVFGLGGTHASVSDQAGSGKRFRLDDLETAFRRSSGLTDAQLGGTSHASDVTNLALVLGMMRSLGISEVTSLNVNLADGLLVTPEYWPPGGRLVSSH